MASLPGRGFLEGNMGWAKETGALGLKEGEVPGRERKRILGISENRLYTLQSLQGNPGRGVSQRLGATRRQNIGILTLGTGNSSMNS